MAEQDQAGAEQAGAEQASAEKRLSIVKIYLKDFSFESPQAPGIFRTEEWAPKTNLNLRSAHTQIDEKLHEIVLTITIEAKDKDEQKTLFLVELHQAGLFDIIGYNKDEFGALIGSFCPNVLFAFARESIANIVQKGGFPEFVLQPINFDALYMQTLAEQQARAAETEAH